MKDLNDIERLFQESFDGFEVSPPPSVKSDIDRQIGGNNRKLLWWLSVALLILITATATLLIANRSTTPQQPESTSSASSSGNTATDNSNDASSSNNLPDQNAKQTALNVPQTAPEQTKQASDVKPTAKKQVQTGKQPLKNNPQQKPKNGRKQQKTKTPKLTKTLGNKVLKTPTNSVVKTPTAYDTGKLPVTSGSSETGKTPNNEKTDPKTSGNDPVSNAGTTSPADSLNADPSKSGADSTLTENTPPTNTEEQNKADKDKDKSTDKPWMISFYTGPQFDRWNTKNKETSFDIPTSWRTSLEVQRNITGNLSASTGVGYQRNWEYFHKNVYFVYDSVYMGIDTIPIYDQQNPDSIIGYEYVEVYGSDSTSSPFYTSRLVNTFSIPLYLHYTFELSENWFLLTDVGATFNFYSVMATWENNPIKPDPVSNDFGINAMLRLHAGYRRGNWMFSAGITGSMYLKTPVTYSGIDTKRLFLSPQLGLHYSF